MDGDRFLETRNLLGGGGVLPQPSLTIIPKKKLEERAEPISQEEQKVVISNTFQKNRDGSSYGIGSDGRTFSYVSGPTGPTYFIPLTVEEQKNAISKASGGRITIDDTITDPYYLSQIHRSVDRMFNYGNRNLIPDSVTISDPNPGSMRFGGFNARGVAYNKGRESTPIADSIELLGTFFPGVIVSEGKESLERGFHTGGATGEDIVPTHELAHTSKYAVDGANSRWLRQQLQEAEKNMNKYPIEKLFQQAVARLFGQNYELTEKDSVGERIYREAYDKFHNRFSETKSSWEIFDEAVENTGFSNLKEAAASISGYAGYQYPSKLTLEGDEGPSTYVDREEIFAEAYTDVLMNGDKAKPFSKELIRLYSEEADRVARMTGRNKDIRVKEFRELFDSVPFGNNSANYQIERTKKLLNNGG